MDNMCIETKKMTIFISIEIKKLEVSAKNSLRNKNKIYIFMMIL